MTDESGERERVRNLVRSAKVRSALKVGLKIMTYSPFLRRGVGGEACELERQRWRSTRLTIIELTLSN